MTALLKLVGLGSPTMLAIYAAVGLPLFGGGFYSAWHLKSLQEEAAIGKAVTAAIKVERDRAALTSSTEESSAKKQAEIRIVYRTLIKKVPVNVSPKADAKCVVPVGFQRLHDAAALGVPDVPGPARKPDGGPVSLDDPSGVPLSSVATTIGGNYEQCHAVVVQLTDLQSWVRQQYALSRQR